MSQKQENLKSSFGNQSWTKTNQQGNWKSAKAPEQPAECFGIERGNRFVRRFKLFFRDGGIISIPYAHLPVIIFNPDKNLKIKTSDIQITVKGRGLDKLSDWLNEEKVLWIKESPSNIDTEDSEVFVSDIQVDGDLLV